MEEKSIAPRPVKQLLAREAAVFMDESSRDLCFSVPLTCSIGAAEPVYKLVEEIQRQAKAAGILLRSMGRRHRGNVALNQSRSRRHRHRQSR
jgi:hypothetical protein